MRQGVNNAADNAIQPSAARDSERGVTSQHKTPYTHDGSTGLGHPMEAGPSMGTGVAGMHSGHATHSSSGHGTIPPVGTTSTATSTPTSTSSGRGFSGDAKNLGRGLKDAVSGHKNQGTTAPTTTSEIAHTTHTTGTTGTMGTSRTTGSGY